MTETDNASAAVDAMIRGALDLDDHGISDDSIQLSNDSSASLSQEDNDLRDDDKALEWHEVIELQAFSERKAWIEEKTTFLGKMPPIEVFAGLDAVRSSAVEVPGLPTRAELEEWLAEHDRIEKETEIFDSGELRKLKKFTKAAAQRNLSPEDTDLIELTLTTIYELDKLFHLLRDRSDNLDLLGIRLTWEERRMAAWSELRSVLSDIREFLASRARWTPNAYDSVPVEDELMPPEPETKRRNSVVSINSTFSESSSNLPPLVLSRTSRYKLAESLSRNAAQFASRVSSLRHSKIAGAGKALDKLIDHSRRPVPDELLDEQDKLEDHGINEMEDVGKFVMTVVMQWKKADEIYVETMKDKSAAQTLLEEIEVATSSHPTSRQDVAFLSRATALAKRLAMRDNPASSGTTFPLPTHLLFPDQSGSNEEVIRMLSSELAAAGEHVRKAEQCAKEYHTSLEAVKRVETACKAASDLSVQLESIVQRLKDGVPSDAGDGTPPDLSTEACLEGSRHASFLTVLPSILQELQDADASVDGLLPGARVAMLHLDRPGVDPQFKLEAGSNIDRLIQLRREAAQTRDEVTARTSALNDIKRTWTSMGGLAKDLTSVQDDIAAAAERQIWHQQVRQHDAPPTPESPVTHLPTPTISPASVLATLDGLATRLEEKVSTPLSAVAPAMGESLNKYLTECSTALSLLLDHTRYLTTTWVSMQNQASTMGAVRDDFHGLQVQTEELKLRFDDAIEGVLSGTLTGDELLLTEGGLSSQLKHAEESVQSFIDDLPRRVTFVAPAHSEPHSSPFPKGPRLTSVEFNLAMVQHAAAAELPVDLSHLDQTVRSDSNAYSMMLSGALKLLEYKATHFQSAKAAKIVDAALASVVSKVRRVADVVTSVQDSMDRPDEQQNSERLGKLSAMVNEVLQVEVQEIARSFSPVRGLMHRLRTLPGVSEITAADGIVASRQRALEDAEAQFATWKENAATLHEQIILALQAERARQIERLRLQEEREQAAAEERARLAREEAETLAKAELDRIEQERRETEERARREQEELEERERLEAENRAKEERSIPQGIGLILGSSELLEPVQETDEHSMTREIYGPEAKDDLFGLQVLPVTADPLSQHTSILRPQILALRKRLRSLHINDVVRPSQKSDLSLPEDEYRKRMDKELLAIVSGVDVLPPSIIDDPLTNAELHSLRTEVKASVDLMPTVHKLADLAIALRNCDDALSDLLEHIDSYPSAPLGMLSSSHTSDPTLPPESQLSARIAFTKSLVDTMTTQYSAVSGDPRAVSEHDRIVQTWMELEAMASDRVNGTKSRPNSVMSSGRSSRASAVSTAAKAAPSKKAAGYSRLSVGGSDARYLAPPPPNRRTTSGSSTGTRPRSTSRVSSISSNRSVSGPTPNVSSATLHGSTFASRQRTTSVTSGAPMKTPLKQPHLASSKASSRPRSNTNTTPRTASPAFSETSSRSISRSGLNASVSSVARSSWSRAPRQSFPALLRSPPKNKAVPTAKKPYIANPKNKLDVAVGDVINSLPVNINVEVVADTWKDQSGKYWIGDQDPKLCFCRILRSQTVMVRVGGGWSELSRFIKDHFADAFRILPESPRLGSREEKWISSATLSQAAESIALSNPKTPEVASSHLPSFALSTPSGTSPKSIKTVSSPGSPLTPLQFLRRADRESPVPRAETPTRPPRNTAAKPARPPVWRP